MALVDDLRETLAQNPASVVFVVGTGVPAGALRGSPKAPLCSWGGLLEHGLDHAYSLHKLDDEVLTHQKQLLSMLSRGAKAPKGSYVAIADMVAECLEAPTGGEFRRWLRDTAGGFVQNIRDCSVLDAIAAHQARGVLLATTNYDHLLEEVTALRPATWRQQAHVERTLRGDEARVLHLHGEWEDPESIVLCTVSYADVARDPHATAILHTLRTTKTFVFVGCGAGLHDPNMGAFLKWSGETFAQSEQRHYRLCLDSEVEPLRRDHPSEQRVLPLPYGSAHSHLADFLRSLLPSAMGVRSVSQRGLVDPPSATASNTSTLSSSTAGLVAFGSRIVAYGYLAGQGDGFWIIRIKHFWQGDLTTLLDYCTDNTPWNERFIAFSSLLDVRPVDGIPRIVSSEHSTDVHVPVGPSWQGSTLGSDIHESKFHRGDYAFRTVAESLEVILTRRLRHERAKIYTFLYHPWLRRLTVEDPQFENVIRLAVTIAARLPSISSDGKDWASSALLEKLVSIKAIGPIVDDSLSEFHRVQICAFAKALTQQQTWEIDVRITEGPREADSGSTGPWILLTRNPTELPLDGGGKIVTVRGVNFVSAELTYWKHLPAKYIKFRERFSGSGLVKANVEGRKGLTSDQIVAAAKPRPQEFYWSQFVRAAAIWGADDEGDRIRERVAECLENSQLLDFTTRMHLGALYDLAVEAGYIGKPLVQALEAQVAGLYLGG